MSSAKYSGAQAYRDLDPAAVVPNGSKVQAEGFPKRVVGMDAG